MNAGRTTKKFDLVKIFLHLFEGEGKKLLSELARLWQDPKTLSHIQAAHEEVRTGRVFRLKGPPTIKRLVQLARSKGILKRRSG